MREKLELFFRDKPFPLVLLFGSFAKKKSFISNSRPRHFCIIWIESYYFDMFERAFLQRIEDGKIGKTHEMGRKYKDSSNNSK